MARKNALGLELSWHKSGRWFKRGKQFGPTGQRYFGPGRSPDDMASYNAALKAYRQWQQEQAVAQRDGESWQRMYDVLRAVNNGSGITPEQVAEQFQGTKAEGGFVQQYLAARADEERRKKLLRTIADKPTPDLEAAATVTASPDGSRPQTVANILDLFDQWNESRNQQRHRNDALRAQGKTVKEKKGQTISDERLGSIRRYIDRWKKSHGRQPWDGSERLATAYLNAWKADADKRGMGDHDEAVKTMRQFVQWAYDNHHLDSLPRNLKNITMKYDVRDAKAIAIPKADLLRLWEAAADDMRAWIALGLNCGFYAKDISDLENRDIGPTHLDHTREKTIRSANVNVRYKLWDVTRTMIDRSRTNTGEAERVWTTRKGQPLVHTATASRSRGKTNSIAKQFRELCKAVGLVDLVKDETTCEERTVARYDFTNVRDTGTTAMEQIDKTLSDIYDAHADSRQARLYVDGKMIDTAPLDAALEKMRATFDLPTPPPNANKWKGKKRKKQK